LAKLRRVGVEVVPIVLTSFAEVDVAVEAMKLGAFDFLTKPIYPGGLQGGVQRALDPVRARRVRPTQERLVVEWEGTFDACPDLMAVLDNHLRIQKCNLAMTRQLAQPKSALVGRFLFDLLEEGQASPGCQVCCRSLIAGATHHARMCDK